MDAQGAGIREELSDALSQLSGLVDKLQQKAMETPAIDNSSGTQQRVEVNVPDLAQAAKRGTTTIVACGAVACVLLTAFSLWIAKEAKDETRALRAEQQAELKALRAEQQMQIAVMQRRLDRIEDYQTTSYMLLPELRKQIEASLSKRKPKEQ